MTRFALSSHSVFLLLRVRAFSHKTFRVYYVQGNLRLGYLRQITVIYGTLKDESLLIDILHQLVVFAAETSSKMASFRQKS